MHGHLHDAMAALADIDPLAAAGFVAILSFSFLASLHCALMCVPLVCALLGSGGAVARSSVALYNLGRFLSYVGAGAALGACGSTLLAMSSAFGYGLAILVALFLFGAVIGAVRPASGGAAPFTTVGA